MRGEKKSILLPDNLKAQFTPKSTTVVYEASFFITISTLESGLSIWGHYSSVKLLWLLLLDLYW